jgi:thiol-disulfide isomerase/thioredoxin
MSLVLRLLCVLCVSAVSLLAQRAEERELGQALAEVGNSTVDFIRVVEGHLAKYPASSRRAELERALAQAALEGKDDRRIILYGERVLARDADDLELLERVARALLAGEPAAQEQSQRALDYARRLETGLGAAQKEPPPSRPGLGKWREELDRALGRALLLQARATGALGKAAAAAALARKAYQSYPSSEPAQEIARWLVTAGDPEGALRHLADAFSIADARATPADRAAIRVRLGELYRKLKNTETGLGDLVLEAYDRTTALLAERRLRLRQVDPNAQLTDPSEYTLSGLDGGKLSLASLRGKVLVLDFWATWCGPCRVQHPLYQQVKQRFKSRPEVVFLSVNTDEDREAVPEFLRENQWDQKVYFDDGLAGLLRVSSIPTTILIGKQGQVVSRMNGFIPERFVDMLAERLEEALKLNRHLEAAPHP